MGSGGSRCGRVATAWAAHLDRRPIGAAGKALLIRRSLTEDDAQAAAALGALFVDVKRTYLELRPQLRRAYVAVGPDGDDMPMLAHLGFEPAGRPVEVDGVSYRPLVLDFGPASVDGWLARLLEAETAGAADGPAGRGGADAGAAEAPLDALTPRELEVLTLVAGGATNKEVAVDLQSSAKTVGRHLENAFAKLGVTNRAAATRIAVVHGLLR